MKHDDATKDLALVALRASGIEPGQRYRHYKTSNVYLVVAVGLFEPNLTPLVHYRRADDEYGIVWTRDLSEFCKQIGFDELGAIFRFTRVE